MGEKPLSMDEAPAQMAKVGGGGPSGGVDTPPPEIAATGLNTTRSNIKSSGAGSVAVGGTGSGQGGDGSDPAGLAIKEQGVRYGDGAADGLSGAASGPVRPTPTNPGDPVPADGRPGDAGGTAMDGDPIPGIDVKLGHN